VTGAAAGTGGAASPAPEGTAEPPARAGRTPAPERAAAAASLTRLATDRPALAASLGRLVAAVADEAASNAGFADALAAALGAGDAAAGAVAGGVGGGVRPARGARRSPGPWDPFAVYAEHGEDVLRERLTGLGLEELRNVVAEHGMDTDRLAMKWRDPERVVGRIVERVVDRAAKGDGFRPPGPG